MQGQTVILDCPSQRRLAHRLIDAAPHGAVANIREAKRTLDQNAKMWALLSDISRAKPEGRTHTPDVWKLLFMNACGHACQFEIGLDGKPFATGLSTSRLSKAKMADLITFIIQKGDEWGVQWTDPAMTPEQDRSAA